MNYPGFDNGLAARRAVEVQTLPSLENSDYKLRYRELTLKVASLQKDYAELHTAVYEAAQVHRRLCAPRHVQYGDFEIASETFAVRHVSGDLFTIEETSAGVVLALSDITGKGLAAGMWTPYVAGLVSLHTAVNSAPETVVRGVNEDLCRMSSVAPLASLFLARLDPVTGSLDYCSAGHPPALLLRADGQLESLSEGGPLLGVIADASFVRGTVELRTGDSLLICSDGLLESRNYSEEEFGYERLEPRLRDARSGSATSVLFSVLGAVQDFAGAVPLVDDMSVVVVTRNHTESNIR